MSQGLLTDSSVLQRSVAAPGNQPQPQVVDEARREDLRGARALMPSWARGEGRRGEAGGGCWSFRVVTAKVRGV